MKNTYLLILALIMGIVTTGYAIEEPQGFIDVYDIQTKHHKHREVLNILHQSSRDGARVFMNDGPLVAAAIRAGWHDVAREMRVRDRENCLRFQADLREQAQLELQRWGYQV
jgi:hypothetical protein